MNENEILSEFKINEFLTLKLQDYKTIIYVKGQEFIQCKHLLLNIPINEISSFDEIQSIDEASESLNDTEIIDAKIPPMVEFWGHCSNLQVWAEYNYNTQLLHSNLAFPLLKKLTESGDSKAANIFKFEILKTFIKGNKTTREFLVEDGYLEHLGEEEQRAPLPDNEISILEKLEKDLQVK